MKLDEKSTLIKFITQVLGFIGVIALVIIDANVPDFTVDRWVYVGMLGFMLGVRPETIPELFKLWSSK